jgi:hypothetical protein
LVFVMPGLVPGIHVFAESRKQRVDGRVIGEQSDAVLRTAMPGHDNIEIANYAAAFFAAKRP